MASFEENTYVFIVRVWLERREIPGAVPIRRGVVENLSGGERRFFTDLEGLLEILKLWIDEPPQPSTEGDTGMADRYPEPDADESLRPERSVPPADIASLQNLKSALARLDRRLAEAVLAAQSVYGLDAARDPYRGLYVSAEEVARLLKREPAEPALAQAEKGEQRLESVTPPRQLPALFAWLGRWLRGSAEDREEIPAGEGSEPPPSAPEPRPQAEPALPLVTDMPLDSPLARLAQMHGLSRFDLDVVLIALAPQLDLRYERLYAYLQDNVSHRRPSVDLVLNLLCTSAEEKTMRRAHFAPGAPLLESGLLHLMPAREEERPPLLSHFVRLDAQVVRLLIGERTLDPRLTPFAHLVAPVLFPYDPLLDGALLELVRQAREDGRGLRLYFQGRPGSARRQTAEWIAAELGTPLLIIGVPGALDADPHLEWLPDLIVREAWLHDALLYLRGFDALRAEGRVATLERLWSALVRNDGITFLDGSGPWAPVVGPPGGVLAVSFATPGYERRRALWEEHLVETDVRLAEEELDALAARFRLSPGQIADAFSTALNLAHLRAARWEDDPEAAQVQRDDLFAAARAQAGHELADLARKIEPLYRWDDIVLPEDTLAQLHEISQRVAHGNRVLEEWGFERKLSQGKGTAVLFAGPSGTGKTMAAEILAADLGLDLYKIDLSGVVSKYVGETEKNLERIFQAAEDSNAILFFDEADALFGKRSEVRDSHDRYANIEISYLLQKMESYDGITILATNLRQNLDDAFVRRMAFTVTFPFPDTASRRRIWEGIWPDDVPRAFGDETLEDLAARFKLSGGNIRNVALAATYLAAAENGAVTMKHLYLAIRREYQKMGKTLSDAEVQSYREQLAGLERRPV
jgi:SpoVK/Ycf46/Vps4 family AAA+-type ATPase